MTSVTAIPRLTNEQWREDLRFFAHELALRHLNPWHTTREEAFEQEVARLEAQIPSLKPYEIVVGIERLASMIGDGHTRLDTHELYHTFPIEVFWFGRELRIIRTIAPYQRAIGARILRIGGHSVHEIHRRLQALIPQAENRWYCLHQSAQHMRRVEPLAALGILSGVTSTRFDCIDDEGNRFVLIVEPLPPESSIAWLASAPPLYDQQRDTSFWFTLAPDTQTIYVNFRSYQNLAQEAAQLWTFVDQHRPQRLVIDMRQNSGGDYTLGREHMVYRAQFRFDLNRAGRLFVITGRATFSAAMTNALDFRRDTAALLVGEPTGARPNSYQELDSFVLPHAQLHAHCSRLYYRFQDKATTAVLSDKRIDPDWQAYQSGRDPVLEWIQQVPLPTSTG